MSGCALMRLPPAALAILIVAVSAPLGAAKAAHSVAAHPAVAARLAILDAWIAETVERRDQPGLSVGIVYDQELIWAKGYGFADVEARRAATPATVYRIASITKLFTATALMQLRDQGKLRLDDRIDTHLPWFKIKDPFPSDPPLTIWHLMTHLSGLPRGSAGLPEGARGFASRDQMIAALPQQELAFPTETEFKYSNLGWALAGEIVAKASGEPYATYIERHILEPLGMRSTFVTPQPTTPELATPYSRRLPGKPRRVQSFSDWAGLTPAANMASTVEDLAKFAALQFRDEPTAAPPVLSPTTLREMQRIHWLRPDWKSGQGLGFAIRRIDDQVQFGHGGVTAGFRTQIQMRADDKMAVIVLANADDGDPGHYVDQVFAVVGPAIHEATHPKRETTADPGWQRYVGRYGREESDNESQVAILNGELTLMTADTMVSDDPWDARVRLAPVREHVFRMRGGSSSGELVVFQVDSEGHVTGMKVATSSQVSPKRAP
jgi:CubicO group peptidase (beta-lactamase class C family)